VEDESVLGELGSWASSLKDGLPAVSRNFCNEIGPFKVASLSLEDNCKDYPPLFECGNAVTGLWVEFYLNPIAR